MPALETMPKSVESDPGSGLVKQLAALRHRWLLVSVATGVAVAIVLALQIGALAMVLDWWLELPWWVRLLSLLGQIFLLGLVLVRSVLLPLLHQPDDDDLALLVERCRPEFRTRLISTIQLTRSPAAPATSPHIIAAAREETEQMAARIDFASLVPTDRMVKLGATALVVSVAALFALGYGAATSFDLLQRLFLSSTPVPRKTRVVVPQGNQLIGIGDNVKLEAVASGVIPQTGQVEIRAAGRRIQRFPMAPLSADRKRFVRTLQNVQESFVYTVQLNDGRSQPYQVRAIPRPTVSTLDCVQHFPPYTGLGPVRLPLGNLALLAGSKLDLHLVATKEIRSGTLKLIGSNQPPASGLLVATTNLAVLTGQISIPATGLTGFSISLVDQEGMESKDSAVYRIEIIPDKVPSVRITAPLRKEELVTRDARLDVGMEVSDDFALAGLALRYKSEAIEQGAVQTVELDLAAETSRRLSRRFTWDLARFRPRLAEETVVEFWIEALDNNVTTGPGVGASEHQIARVVSENEKRADLLNRAGDIFSSLNDAADDQEKLNRRLGDIILEKSGVR